MSAGRRLLSHIDLRVRDKTRAIDFYDAILGTLGAIRSEGATFTGYEIPPPEGGGEADDWFGFTVDPDMVAGSSRIAFIAPTRGTVEAIATILPAAGASDIEWADGDYGPDYYAVFFADPDGNKLEICCLG